jgi:drug/metabolite transporter (DMT)-like permease
MLETVLGPLWVWLVLSERPATATLTGGALILAALVANTLIDLLTATCPSGGWSRRALLSRFRRGGRQ